MFLAMVSRHVVGRILVSWLILDSQFIRLWSQVPSLDLRGGEGGWGGGGFGFCQIVSSVVHDL